MLLGQKLGDFEIEGELGAGAMGMVYRARYLKNNSPVAIKIISGGQTGVDRAIAADRFGAAAQDRGIACHRAERAGVGSHIGAALVDDADHPDRHPHPGQLEPVGPLDAVDDFTDRIVEPCHRLDAGRHRLDPFGIEPQSVEQRGGKSVGFARSHIGMVIRF